MPQRHPRLLLLSLLTVVSFSVGCNDGPADKSATGAHTDDHAEHDHESTGPDDHAHDDHAHPTEGPHHGMLVELGAEEYHAEIVHDDKAETLTVYLLDSTAKAEATSEAPEVIINIRSDSKPQQFKLLPPEGSPGNAKFSEYSLASKPLLDALHEKSTTAKLSITINGKPYSGEIPHESHAAHDHAH